MSVNSKMTAIADKVRSLLGISTKQSLDSMSANLDSIVDEVDTQADLINQIITNLNGKVAGGSGSSGATNELVTVTFTAPPFTSYIGYIDGNLQSFYISSPVGDTSIQVRKNTSLIFIDESNIGISTINVSDGISYVPMAYQGVSASPYFFVAFDITDSCSIEVG